MFFSFLYSPKYTPNPPLSRGGGGGGVQAPHDAPEDHTNQPTH